MVALDLHRKRPRPRIRTRSQISMTSKSKSTQCRTAPPLATNPIRTTSLPLQVLLSISQLEAIKLSSYQRVASLSPMTSKFCAVEEHGQDGNAEVPLRGLRCRRGNKLWRAILSVLCGAWDSPVTTCRRCWLSGSSRTNFNGSRNTVLAVHVNNSLTWVCFNLI